MNNALYRLQEMLVEEAALKGNHRSIITLEPDEFRAIWDECAAMERRMWGTTPAPMTPQSTIRAAGPCRDVTLVQGPRPAIVRGPLVPPHDGCGEAS